jgi:hypothetical protein
MSKLLSHRDEFICRRDRRDLRVTAIVAVLTH